MLLRHLHPCNFSVTFFYHKILLLLLLWAALLLRYYHCTSVYDLTARDGFASVGYNNNGRYAKRVCVNFISLPHLLCDHPSRVSYTTRHKDTDVVIALPAYWLAAAYYFSIIILFDSDRHRNRRAVINEKLCRMLYGVSIVL